MSSIQRNENRSNSQRNAMIRAESRKNSEIAKKNQKLAIKLFTTKPTYQAVNLEKDFKAR